MSLNVRDGCDIKKPQMALQRVRINRDTSAKCPECGGPCAFDIDTILSGEEEIYYPPEHPVAFECQRHKILKFTIQAGNLEPK
jgi:hypothetical protein